MSTVESHSELLTQIRLLTESNNRRLKTEEQTLDQLKEIRDVVVGSPNQRGLVHRMDDTEKFINGFKKWAIVFVLAIAGGEPVVDRVLPDTSNKNNDAIVALLTQMAGNNAGGETPSP